MREIITFHVGNCGNSVGQKFWEVIASEHGIDVGGKFRGQHKIQAERLNVYFNEGRSSQFIARAIGFDCDPAGVLQLQNCPFGRIFSRENMISGHESNSNNFAKGYLTEGVELMEPVLEKARKEAESCDLLEGFQIFHSLGGGTGSGTTSLLLRHLAEEYPRTLVSTYTVIPSPKVSEIVVEPYNTILGLPQLTENSQFTVCYDNDAMYDICIRTLNLSGASFHDMNFITAHTIAGLTACFRFPGQLNTDLNKLYVNMVPFPNLHFFVPSFAPLMSPQMAQIKKLTVPELVYQIFNGKNWLVDCDMRHEKMFTAAAVFRGRMSPKEVDHLMHNIQAKNSDHFVEWIPNNLKSAICDIPPRGLKLSATLIANTTAIHKTFQRLHNQFEAMFRRRGYVHWYVGEGMEENEIFEAGRSVKELLQAYRGRDDDEAAEAQISACGTIDS